MTPLLIAQVVLTLVVFQALLLAAAAMVWVERRLAAALQQRLGPTRVGWQGLLQPFADVIKLMFKEELRPRAADALLFALAPIISATAAFAAFAVVPFGAETTIFGLLREPLRLQVADVNAAVLLIANSMSLTDIVNRQAGTWLGIVPRWLVFLQPIGFLIFMIAGIAETNRAPFDFPEAEQELVAGYHTEYS